MIPTPAPALPSSSSVSPSLHHTHAPNKTLLLSQPHPQPQPHHHQQQQFTNKEPWITALFDSCADPIIVCDLNGLVCAWSHSAHSTFDIHPKQTLGLSLRHIFSSAGSSLSSPPTTTSTTGLSLTSSIPGNHNGSNHDNRDDGNIKENKESLEIELYPSTPEQVRTLLQQGSSSHKRVVSRVVSDRSRHIFLESISPVFQHQPPQQQQQQLSAAAPSSQPRSSRTPPPLPPRLKKPLPPLPYGTPNLNNAAGTTTATTGKPAINGHSSSSTSSPSSGSGSSSSHSHTADKDDPATTITLSYSITHPSLSSSAKEEPQQRQQRESTISPDSTWSTPAPSTLPQLVGYSVILTDLSTLSLPITMPGTTSNNNPFFASYPQSSSSMASSALTSSSSSSVTTSTTTTTISTTKTSAASSAIAAEEEHVAGAALSAQLSTSAESKDADAEVAAAAVALIEASAPWTAAASAEAFATNTTTATTATITTALDEATAASSAISQQTQQTPFSPHQTLVQIASDDNDAITTTTTVSWSAALPMSEASIAATATANNNNHNDTDNDNDRTKTTTASMSSSSSIAFRPSTSREHSTDSGFDERSPMSKPKRDSITAAVVANSIQRGSSPHHHHLMPILSLPGQSQSQASSVSFSSSTSSSAVVFTEIQSEPEAITSNYDDENIPSLFIAQPQPLPLPLPLAMPISRSNSISLPIHSQEPSVRPSARSTSLGHLLSLPPLSPFSPALINRPRALSIAATASTSTGAQLSVSMSAPADKSRLDIHHNSLAISTDTHHPSSLLPGETRLDREWDDPAFSYLAPIAANLLTCHGDHFFDLVVEELSLNLGVKYAFISQLVSLDELKELDPTEYMNLIEQFGGLVPPLDGVMHNISSWPGESHINPHAFQGYLADCTIQDKVTFIDSNLADQHQDVAECLMDHTIESYVGMRLETVQGEIVGVIGIIHDRALTEEDSMIVKLVLEQVGIRVANELDRLKIESNLIYARDVAESTAKNKTKFLADMSHEIRNPMNAVVGVTDILLDTAGLSDEQTGFIEVIRTSGQHLLTVINDILDISRIDQDVKFLLERRPLSLRKCLKDAVSLAGLTPLHDVSRSISVIEWPPEMDDLGPFSELEETNILPLLWSIDHNVPEHLLGDITRLRQVLINLCTNSLKFTQRGRVSVHVSIHQPTAQYPTIRPNSSPMVTRNTPQGGQAYSPAANGGPSSSSSSSPSSPMLTGNDHRTPMVFQQRYDVKADPGPSTHIKPSPGSTRRRQADKRHLPLPSPNMQPYQSSSSFAPLSLTVVAPTANSLEGDKMDENTVILEFAVSDTGVGIPANKITELFTSFSQVDISVSTRFGGTGLGLAISASLVEKMGGNIWVESTEGVGSRFTFTIPFTICQSSETESHPSVTAPSSPVSTPVRHESASRGNLDAIQLPASSIPGSPSLSPTPDIKEEEPPVQENTTTTEEEEKLSESSMPSAKCNSTPHSEASKPTVPTYAKVVESTLRPLTIDGAPLRILLAEDNSVNQKIAVGVLKKLGYENVDIAENGLQVIQKLDQGSIYDVILMDVSMPVMDGIDATKTIVDRRLRGLLTTAAESSSYDTLSPEGHQCNGISISQESSPERGYKDYQNLYVIALTASAMGSDKERCMEAGMDDFMTKPFALLEMKRVLNEFIHKWDGGVLQLRNETCVATALAAVKSRCTTPNEGRDNDRSLTPTNGKSPSVYSSTVSLADHDSTDSLCSLGCSIVTDGHCGDGHHTSTSSANGSSPPSSIGRSRIETPRPLRRNLDAIGCSLFSAGRRSNSEAMLSGALGPIPMEGGLLAARRASDVFSLTKREWRSGLGLSNDNLNGVHDVHPLDPLINGAQAEQDRENGVTSPSNSNHSHNHSLAPYHHSHGSANGFSHPHLRVKRVMSPSSLSKEQDFGALCKPTASPLSPLSLLTTDTEGSSSVSPPLSSSSTASPTEDSPPRSSGDSSLLSGPRDDPTPLSVPIKENSKAEMDDVRKKDEEVKEVKENMDRRQSVNGHNGPTPSSPTV